MNNSNLIAPAFEIYNGTDWYPEKNLVITRLSGKISQEGVEKWESSLKVCLDKIPDNGSFKILINLHGFIAADIVAHKRFRNILPVTLSAYGWKIGYVDEFEEAKEIIYTNTRGVGCYAAAHCHDDKNKMDYFESKFGRQNERYFSEALMAMQWIEGLNNQA